MATQDTNATSLYLKKEASWAETVASATMVQWPFSSCSFTPNKKTVVSEHIRSDRMRDDLAFVGEDVDGSVAWELQPVNVGGTNYMGLVLGGIMARAFPSQTTATGVSVAAGKFHKTGITATLSVIAGDYFTSKGFTAAANNGLFRVVSTSADDITVAETLTTETTNGTVYNRKFANGTTETSFRTEQVFSNITKYGYDTGLEIDSMGLEIVAEQVIKCTATLKGSTESMSGSSIGGTRTAANTKSVMTASVNVGTLQIDGSAIGVGVKRASFNLKNNIRTKPQVGSRTPRGVGMGYFDVEGTLEVYFEDTTLYDASRDHDDVALIIPITSTEAYGDGYAFEFPRIKFGNPTKAIQGGNGDVTLVLPFTGLRHATKDAQCIIHAMGETA